MPSNPHRNIRGSEVLICGSLPIPDPAVPPQPPPPPPPPPFICFTIVGASITNKPIRLFVGCELGQRCGGWGAGTPNGVIGGKYCDPIGLYGSSGDSYISIGIDTDAVGTYMIIYQDNLDYEHNDGSMSCFIQFEPNVSIISASGIYTVPDPQPGVHYLSNNSIIVSQQEGAHGSIVQVRKELGQVICSTNNPGISNTYFQIYISGVEV